MHSQQPNLSRRCQAAQRTSCRPHLAAMLLGSCAEAMRAAVVQTVARRQGCSGKLQAASGAHLLDTPAAASLGSLKYAALPSCNRLQDTGCRWCAPGGRACGDSDRWGSGAEVAGDPSHAAPERLPMDDTSEVRPAGSVSEGRALKLWADVPLLPA